MDQSRLTSVQLYHNGVSTISSVSYQLHSGYFSYSNCSRQPKCMTCQCMTIDPSLVQEWPQTVHQTHLPKHLWQKFVMCLQWTGLNQTWVRSRFKLELCETMMWCFYEQHITKILHIPDLNQWFHSYGYSSIKSFYVGNNNITVLICLLIGFKHHMNFVP